jgi:hypothetical protein
MSRCAGYIRLDAPSCRLFRPAIRQYAQAVDERVDRRFQRDTQWQVKADQGEIPQTTAGAPRVWRDELDEANTQGA